VLFRMKLAGSFGMVFGVQIVAMRCVRMMGSVFHVLLLVMFGSLAVMMRGLLVMRGGLFVMVRDL